MSKRSDAKKRMTMRLKDVVVTPPAAPTTQPRRRPQKKPSPNQ